MGNKMKYLLILSIILYFPVSAWCATYKVEINGINYSINGDYVTVIEKSDGTKYSGNIVIPEEIEYNSSTYTVKSLGNAFQGCDELLTLELPNTIETLGSFMGCTKLETLYIPSGITSFFENQFAECKNLRSVHITDLSAWCKIVFHQMKRTGNINYDYVKFVSNPLQNGADLYLNGKKLVDFVVPETISVIPHYAFYGCSSFETITISDKTTVYQSAFANNINLKTLHLYSKSISNQSFSGCTSLTMAYLYNTTGTENSFQNCPNLETVLLPKDEVQVDQYYSSDQRWYMYQRFSNVKKFIIQDGTSKIGKSKFYNCSNLETVYIPSTVKLMGNSAFAYCNYEV